MATKKTLYDFSLWRKDSLVRFLRDRGLPVSGTVAELRALAYSANVMGVPVKPTAEEENIARYKS